MTMKMTDFRDFAQCSLVEIDWHPDYWGSKYLWHVGQCLPGYTAQHPSKKSKSKAVPLHAMEALGGRGGIAPTHSRPRH
jgi:hypothetical protein